MQAWPEELTNVVKSGFAAALVGMVYGGLPAARHARERFIQLSQAEIYHSRVEAVVSGVVCTCSVMHVCNAGTCAAGNVNNVFNEALVSLWFSH